MKNALKTGILLINLGTPNAPTVKAVREYLAEFLSDPRVIEIPKWLWLPILYGIVLQLRPKISAKAYQKIWTKEGSPLLVGSKKIMQGISETLQQNKDSIIVELGMRYGSPSIASALENLRKAEVKKIIVLPLYPQYSSSATGSAFSAVTEALNGWYKIPQLHFIDHYFENTDYLDAISTSITEFWQQHGVGDKLLFSFHGLPEKSITAGDPYYSQCQTTAKTIAEKLKLIDSQWQLVFQSRFGKQKWLQPYCDKTLEKLAQQGCKKVDVICPGFAADCLETLEEMAIRNHEMFLTAGGKKLSYIPALNDSKVHVQFLANIISRYL